MLISEKRIDRFYQCNADSYFFAGKQMASHNHLLIFNTQIILAKNTTSGKLQTRNFS